MSKLEEQIKVVAGARLIFRGFSNAWADAYAKWETDNEMIIEPVSIAKQGVEEAEALLRELTLQAYAATGDKAPAPGVGIRERTVLTYDGKVAFDWAKSHKMALKLDTSAFEKIVKASDSLDFTFVKITLEPMATIATKLEV